MANRKYITIKTRDIREHLAPQEQEYLTQLVDAINQRKHQKNPNQKVPTYFTLNTSDKYAVPALEAYIAAIDDDDANNINMGVVEARQVAAEARQIAIINHDGSKLPG